MMGQAGNGIEARLVRVEERLAALIERVNEAIARGEGNAVATSKAISELKRDLSDLESEVGDLKHMADILADGRVANAAAIKAQGELITILNDWKREIETRKTLKGELSTRTQWVLVFMVGVASFGYPVLKDIFRGAME